MSLWKRKNVLRTQINLKCRINLRVGGVVIGNLVGVGVGVEESNGRPSNVAVIALENGL